MALGDTPAAEQAKSDHQTTFSLGATKDLGTWRTQSLQALNIRKTRFESSLSGARRNIGNRFRHELASGNPKQTSAGIER
ncbi:hypothetical protein [Bradyrhizobium sp. USDA 4502]